MATNSVNSFVNALKGGGARANQFRVSFPALDGSTGLMEFMGRGAQIPAVTMGEVTVPYRGRQVFVPGDRTYDAWTITVFNDSGFTIRGALENWQNQVQDIGSTTQASIEGMSVYRDASVLHLGRNGEVLRTYNLFNCWPTTVDAIDLAFDTNDAVEEFGVTFRFNYMTVASGSEGARSRANRFASNFSTEGGLGSGPGSSTGGIVG